MPLLLRVYSSWSLPLVFRDVPEKPLGILVPRMLLCDPLERPDGLGRLALPVQEEGKGVSVRRIIGSQLARRPAIMGRFLQTILREKDAKVVCGLGHLRIVSLPGAPC